MAECPLGTILCPRSTFSYLFPEVENVSYPRMFLLLSPIKTFVPKREPCKCIFSSACLHYLSVTERKPLSISHLLLIELSFFHIENVVLSFVFLETKQNTLTLLKGSPSPVKGVYSSIQSTRVAVLSYDLDLHSLAGKGGGGWPKIIRQHRNIGTQLYNAHFTIPSVDEIYPSVDEI